jgi:hypothetical protein
VRCGVTSPSVSQARNAEEEIPTRLATSLMRSAPPETRETDGSDEFFLLDITAGFP